MGASATETVRAPSRSEAASWILLAIGVLGASISAILIRYADGADPLAISFWRSAIGAVVLAPFARSGLARMKPADFKAPAIAGLFLAVHFATWITSVELTSVAASVLLLSTAPVFVAIAARWIFNERLPRSAWIGIILTVTGAALIGAADNGGESSMWGNFLALIGGATAGGYFMAAQVARRTLGILEFAVATYGITAALMLVACLIGGVELFGYPSDTWWAIAGIVVGPQLLGHTLINLVLDDIDATTVAVVVMAEPIIATGLAWMLFSETPSWLLYPGGIAILVGIYLVTAARRVATPIVE